MLLLFERKKFSSIQQCVGLCPDIGKNIGVVGAHKIYSGITLLQCKERRKKHQKGTGETSNVVGLARLTKKIKKTQMTNISKERGDIN